LRDPSRSAGAGSPEVLPSLAEPTRTDLLVAGLAIAAAAGLLVAAGVRIADRVDLARWWVPLAFLAGMTAADFASGVVHWGADTWGRADLPVIGPRLLVPFRVHHLNPDDFLRRRFLDTNGDVAALTIPALLGLLFVPLETATQQALAVAGFALCAFGGLTNQIHQWAHMPEPPAAVRWLQGAGLLLPGRQHARHHGAPYDGCYCITLGWCNGPLDATGFFRRLEGAITWLTGAQPRDDERVTRGRAYGGRARVQDV
jgi:ubiquitin-conjugating enzyme E2 variant